MDNKLLNGLTLAYVGDSAYELLIRKRLILDGLTKSDRLHKTAINYTKASAQATIVRYLLANNFFTDEEILIYKRGRNSHVHLTRKNIALADYLDATGLEALVGYLFLEGNEKRIKEIIDNAFDIIKGGAVDGR